MPIYDYVCSACDTLKERLVGYPHRDAQKCMTCDGPLQRQAVQRFVGHVAVETGARLWDGTRVKGHFGKSAKLRRSAKAKN